MKYLLMCLSIAVTSIIQATICKAQTRANSAYAEFMGNGVVYSLNYERGIIKNRDWLSARIGIGIYPITRGNEQGLLSAIPLEVLTRGFHKNFELGLGFTPFSNPSFEPLSGSGEEWQKVDQTWESKVFVRAGFVSNTSSNGIFWKAAFVGDVYDSDARKDGRKNNVVGFGFAIGKKF